MTALQFYEKLQAIKAEYSEIILDQPEISLENVLSRFDSREAGIAHWRLLNVLRGTLITPKAIKTPSTNPIQDLVLNYDLRNMRYWGGNLVFHDTVVEEDSGEFIFGELDLCWMCYRPDGRVEWLDADVYTLLCPIALNPDLFLDCIFLHCENMVYRRKTSEALVEELVIVSQEPESASFFRYLLGVE